jgi:hypothetical protein
MQYLFDHSKLGGVTTGQFRVNIAYQVKDFDKPVLCGSRTAYHGSYCGLGQTLCPPHAGKPNAGKHGLWFVAKLEEGEI